MACVSGWMGLSGAESGHSAYIAPMDRDRSLLGASEAPDSAAQISVSMNVPCRPIADEVSALLLAEEAE